MGGAWAHLPGERQLQEEGQQNAALMQSLMHAAAAGMGQPMLPMMQMGRAPDMAGQPGLPMQQVRSNMQSPYRALREWRVLFNLYVLQEAPCKMSVSHCWHCIPSVLRAGYAVPSRIQDQYIIQHAQRTALWSECLLSRKVTCCRVSTPSFPMEGMLLHSPCSSRR